MTSDIVLKIPSKGHGADRIVWSLDRGYLRNLPEKFVSAYRSVTDREPTIKEAIAFVDTSNGSEPLMAMLRLGSKMSGQNGQVCKSLLSIPDIDDRLKPLRMIVQQMSVHDSNAVHENFYKKSLEQIVSMIKKEMISDVTICREFRDDGTKKFEVEKRKTHIIETSIQIKEIDEQARQMKTMVDSDFNYLSRFDDENVKSIANKGFVAEFSFMKDMGPLLQSIFKKNELEKLHGHRKHEQILKMIFDRPYKDTLHRDILQRARRINYDGVADR